MKKSNNYNKKLSNETIKQLQNDEMMKTNDVLSKNEINQLIDIYHTLHIQKQNEKFFIDDNIEQLHDILAVAYDDLIELIK